VSFRGRIALAAAAAVAIAVVLASLLVYLLTSGQLHSQVDNQLRTRAHETRRLERLFAVGALRIGPNGAASINVSAPSAFAIAAKEAESDIPSKLRENGKDARHRVTIEPPGISQRPGSLFGKLPPNPDQVRGYQQVVDSNGKVLARSAQNVTLPVDRSTALLAERGGEPFFRNVTVGGVHMRLLAEPFGRNRAEQLALPLAETNSLLSRLRLILFLVVIGGIALAALLGLLVAGTAVLPLKRLTQTTEHVTRTQDLSERIAPTGEDELGRLASSFNAMLDALERSMTALDASVGSQRQLVADASHELRTPVTSVRTNIELLQRLGPEMDAAEHRRLLDDVVGQLEELTVLINDLIDLSRGEEPGDEVEDVRLDLLVEEVVQKTGARASATLNMKLEPSIIAGVPARLARAVGNLLDNAVKYSPPEAPIEVRLRGKELTVRDHGPGISEEDLPHIFDRFYRGAEARRRPGSGLGLSIVRQVAEQMGGAVAAEPAPGGGTLMRLRLPGLEPAVEEPEDESAGRRSPAAARP
jgi:two-component system sensor histidine kinase MprB